MEPVKPPQIVPYPLERGVGVTQLLTWHSKGLFGHEIRSAAADGLVL